MKRSIWRKPEPSNTHLKDNFFGKSEKQSFFSPNTIQPKLTIGAPNDKYEQEADAMADRVVSQPNSAAAGNIQNSSPAIQTKCAECDKEKGVQRMSNEEEEGSVQRMEEEEAPAIQQMPEEEGEMMQKMGEEEEAVQRMGEEEEPVQRMGEEEEGSVQTKPLMRQAANGGGVATSNLSNQLSNSKGNGHALPKATNQYMSQSFGRDFSQVRIHTDSRAKQMNKGIHAKAFTHGKDIYFNSGQYDPNSTKGKRLLAHELTHVVQQGGGEIKKQGAKEATREKLIIWMNAFIPYHVPGVTKKIPDGPFKGGSMLNTPWYAPHLDCFVTDGRSFDSSPGAAQRIRHAVIVDLDTLNYSTNYNIGVTHEIDCEDGDVECTSMGSISGLKTNTREKSQDILSLDITGAANNPCAAGSPNIDYFGHIRINKQSRIIAFAGMVDNFPAYEMYAVSTTKKTPLTVFQSMPPKGKDPSDLFGGAGNLRIGSSTF